jgi:hypothetical protein
VGALSVTEGAVSFYLGVWKSPAPISDAEAAARYNALNNEKSGGTEFDGRVYAFYCRLTELYPEVEMVPEDELRSCPWASSIDMAGDHLILPIQPEQCEKVVPEVVALAEQYELVCFDPQAGKVLLPPRLIAQQVAALTDSVSGSDLQLSATQPNGEPETDGGEALQPNPSVREQ